MTSFTACRVAGVSFLTPTAAKTMGGKLVDLSSAVGALVWSAKWGAKFELRPWVASLSPNATWVVSSSSRSPRLGTGRACSQAPDSLLHAVSILARELASDALSIKAWDVAQTLGKSHAF